MTLLTDITSTTEHFVIESMHYEGQYYSGQCNQHLMQFTRNISNAVKFQSINTAIQFNRIIEGRIASVFK